VPPTNLNALIQSATLRWTEKFWDRPLEVHALMLKLHTLAGQKSSKIVRLRFTRLRKPLAGRRSSKIARLRFTRLCSNRTHLLDRKVLRSSA